VSKIGPLAATETFPGIQLPINPDTGMTLGFAFVEYQSADAASQAVKSLTGYGLDKNHTLTAIPYLRAMDLANLEEGEFTQPEPAPFKEKPNTSLWLQDSSQRDQFVIRQGKETVVNWSDARNEPVVDYDGSREKEAGVAWCEYYVQWSPHGSYLATLVPSKGVILWGGDKYEKIGRFPAPGVDVVLFSPCEKYLLTSNNKRDDPDAVKIFSIQTGKLQRAFPLFPNGFIPEDLTTQERTQIPPPAFQWSHDDKYLARMGKDIISIYDTATFKLLDSRSLTANGIQEFQFSPEANILSCWSPESGNSPAHVDIVELPSRKKLRQKNLFNVTKCSMVWQNEGTYLAVKVTRHTKSKKTLYNNLELFRLDEPGVPVEMMDIKDAIMALAWEPCGHRFAMIHAENPNSTKVNVSFYDMQKTVVTPAKGRKKQETNVVNEVNLMETLAGKQCNCIFWSPAGQNIILASLGDSASGALEFYDVKTKALVIKEHYRANQVVWDPTGRTVASCVTQPIQGGHFKFAMDNGYVLWTFQGKQLQQLSFETFYQFQWRPRESLLTKAEKAKVLKNLKKYEREFDKADKALAFNLQLEATKAKRSLRTEFRNRLARLNELKRQQKAARIALYNGYDVEDESHYVTNEVSIETILSTKEEIV
jgi:translation initiation factor 3 subunit B